VQQVKLGTDGPLVSRLAFGAMTLGHETEEKVGRELLDTFVESGGTLIDTADVYNGGISEQWIGQWLADTGARDRIVLATKARFPVTGQPGASLRPEYLRTALDASLRRLNVDYVDLHQIHGPDAKHPVDVVVEFYAEAWRAGKVRHAGVSNLAGWQLAKLGRLFAEAGTDVPPLVSHQPQYSLIVREAEWEVIPAAIDAGLGAIVWGPLAAGWLTGKYRRDETPPAGSRLGDDPTRGSEAWDRRGTERTWAILDRLRAVAAEQGVTPAQAALAWVADRPGVAAPIVGARSVAQLRETLEAADLHLDPAATAALDEVSAPAIPDYPYHMLSEIAEW